MTEPLTESGAPLQTDVAIVGAGPAGSATALALVQRDRSWAGRLLLIDRAHHPRHKLCGGAITPAGVAPEEARAGQGPGFTLLIDDTTLLDCERPVVLDGGQVFVRC